MNDPTTPAGTPAHVCLPERHTCPERSPSRPVGQGLAARTGYRVFAWPGWRAEGWMVHCPRGCARVSQPSPESPGS
jgi:hypothetical protein